MFWGAQDRQKARLWGKHSLIGLLPMLRAAEWSAAELKNSSIKTGTTLAAVAQPTRAELTGRTASPGLFAVMEILSHEETPDRIADIAMWLMFRG